MPSLSLFSSIVGMFENSAPQHVRKDVKKDKSEDDEVFLESDAEMETKKKKLIHKVPFSRVPFLRHF